MKTKIACISVSLLLGFACLLLPQSVSSQGTSSEIVIETSPSFLQADDLLTLNISLVEDITETFDFYFAADTPYGVYTVFFDGSYRRGIRALYTNVPGYSAPYTRTIFDNFRLPSRKMGPYTFYAVAVRAGTEITSLSDLAPDNDYVIIHVTETAITYTANTTPTPAPPVNSSDRSGDFYLPTAYNVRILPLLVAFHGTGGSGEGMVNSFQSLAAEYGFIIIAPDSREMPGDPETWYITTAGNESTDYPFIMEWVDYIRNFPGVTIDNDYVMTLGFSAGCPVAPYIATNDDQFTAFASMHGEVWEPSIGDDLALAWLSTGQDDWWTPAMYQGYATMLTGKGFTVTNTTYPGGHSISDTEKSDVIDWWLGP